MKQFWFQWEAICPRDGPTNGLCKAPSLHRAKQHLIRHQLIVRRLTRLPNESRSKRHRMRRILTFLHRWKELLEAGIDQHGAWGYLHQSSTDQAMANATSHIQKQLAQGDTLEHALRHQSTFPPTLSVWVGIGEQTGRLPEVLTHVYTTMTHQYEEREAVQAALRYPITVFSMAVLMLVGMIAFLLPRFADVFSQLNTPLPALTLWVMALNDIRVLQGILISAGLSLLTLFWIRGHWDHWLQQRRINQRLYRIPWVGPNWRTTHLLRDLQMLLLALKSHVPLQQACTYTATFSASAVWRTHWSRTADQLKQGQTFTLTQRHQALPPELIQAIRIGEESGRLPNQLAFVTQQLHQSLHAKRQQRLSFLPTGVLIGVSAITLVVLLSLYLPLFQLGQALG